MATPGLDAVLADPRIWRARRAPGGKSVGGPGGIPSGIAALDAALPEGGFPAAALTELHVRGTGLGELTLLLPALARLTHTGRALAFVAPPHLPYAPLLTAAGIELGSVFVVQAVAPREVAWATEQALRDGSCGAVLAWFDASGRRAHAAAPMPPASLRRLQLAAAAGDSWGVLFRPWAARRDASPAALRLALTPTPAGLRVEAFKCRGSSGRFAVEIASG